MFSYTQKQKVTQHLIFLLILILQQKIKKFDKIWLVDAGYFWFNCFCFHEFYHSDLNIRHSLSFFLWW